MSELVEFLRARLDEDEQAARDAYYEGQRWISEEETVYRWPDDEAVYSADRKRDAAHIVRWQPSRVLAEVEMKRTLLVGAFATLALIDGEWGCCHDADEIEAGACESSVHEDSPELRALTMPYASHPDWREEWRP